MKTPPANDPSGPSATSRDAQALLREHGAAVDAALAGLRQRYAADAPPRLLEAVDYSLLAGGKRLRPCLVLETCRACGGDPVTNKSALAAAVAIELIHTFSLVHDDLPSMDDDDLRRGRPTNHKVFGEAMAVLAGDAMTTMAFGVLARDADPSLVCHLVGELAAASGPAGMIGGQVLDIDGENQSLSLDALKRVHRLKTGALLTAACRLGAIAAVENNGEGAMFKAAGAAAALLGPGPVKRRDPVRDFGRHLGLAFQIVDDVLDVTSTPQQLGKATNKDAGRGKNTYPGLLGLDASRRMAQAELQAALSAIEPLGPAADGLRALARFVVERNV